VDQEAERLIAIIESHQRVTRLLGDPGACWVRRAGDELDTAALERDEEEHVDPFQQTTKRQVDERPDHDNLPNQGTPKLSVSVPTPLFDREPSF
jgi:hypothetical protein